MYEKFTDRARKTMALANQEAQRFNHEYVGTEHILLGMIKEGGGAGPMMIQAFGIDLRKVRLEVEKLVRSGPPKTTLGKLPQTPRAKKVIKLAIEAAREFGHGYVGSEHLLLGLIREKDGVTSQVLLNLGVITEEIEKGMRQLFAPEEEQTRITVKLEYDAVNVLSEYFNTPNIVNQDSLVKKAWEEVKKYLER